MSEELIKSVQEMLNEEKWTRVTIANYTKSNFIELGAKIEAAKNENCIDEVKAICDEYLVHAVDVEGKKTGIDAELAQLLGSWKGIPVTYAGGVRSLSDLEILYKYGENLDVTIGSSLDLFGGELVFDEVVEFFRNKKGAV